MAVPTADQLDHLSRLSHFAERMVEQERNEAFIGNYEWAGVPDYDTLITQSTLDAFTVANPNSPLANMKLSDIAEVEYVQGQLNTLINDKFPQLFAVAKHAG